MSQQKVEALQAVYGAVSRRDWDAALEKVPAGFEFETGDSNPIAGTYRGREEVRRFFEELFGAFREVRIEPERIIDLDDRILVFSLMYLRPTESDAAFETRIAHLWTVRGGEILRCKFFAEREKALEAVGLRE
jgi:uncharacterized protein